MTKAPPYTISLQSADYLVRIAEAMTRLELGTEFKRDIRLHRENRLRSIYSSLAIEGNTLSLGEVIAVVEGKLVAGKQTEIKEVKNAYEAYDKIMTYDPCSVKDFLKAHKLMTDGLVKEAGKFRSGDVGVFDGDVVVHMGARPQFVPQLVKELFYWAKETELQPVIKSAILHYEIETIHPFADGNGRMGRLWQTLVLAKWNELFAWMPMETVLFQNRPHYYYAIEAARKINDASPFIEFTLSALLETINAQAEQIKKDGIKDGLNDGIKGCSRDGLNDVQKKMLKLIESNSRITADMLAAELSINKRNAEKNIKVLKDAGLLVRVGARRSGHWIIKNPDDISS